MSERDARRARYSPRTATGRPQTGRLWGYVRELPFPVTPGRGTR